MLELGDVIRTAEGNGAGSISGLQSLLRGLGGGNRTSSASTASNVANVSVSPVIVNNVGSGAPQVSPYVDSGITGGNPSVGATAQATGSDYLPGRQSTSPSYLGASRNVYADPLSGQSDNSGLLLAGAAALMFFLMDE